MQTHARVLRKDWKSVEEAGDITTSALISTIQRSTILGPEPAGSNWLLVTTVSRASPKKIRFLRGTSLILRLLIKHTNTHKRGVNYRGAIWTSTIIFFTDAELDRC